MALKILRDRRLRILTYRGIPKPWVGKYLEKLSALMASNKRPFPCRNGTADFWRPPQFAVVRSATVRMSHLQRFTKRCHKLDNEVAKALVR
jgi:hypothetical protein